MSSVCVTWAIWDWLNFPPPIATAENSPLDVKITSKKNPTAKKIRALYVHTSNGE
jgi:hypothetical protein